MNPLNTPISNIPLANIAAGPTSYGGGGSKFIPMEHHTCQPIEGKFFVWSVAKLKHF